MRPTQPRTDRRGFLLLGAGLGAALVSGCELNNPFSTTSTPAAEAVRDLSPDAAAAVKAVVKIRTVQETVGEAQTFPVLRTRVAGLAALHRAHLQVLVPAVPHGVDADGLALMRPAFLNAQGALGALVLEERQLRQLLLDLAGAAESGPFARLLGTMAGGLSQQLARLGR